MEASMGADHRIHASPAPSVRTAIAVRHPTLTGRSLREPLAQAKQALNGAAH
jgi:hypothetical protein